MRTRLSPPESSLHLRPPFERILTVEVHIARLGRVDGDAVLGICEVRPKFANQIFGQIERRMTRRA